VISFTGESLIKKWVPPGHTLFVFHNPHAEITASYQNSPMVLSSVIKSSS